MATGRWARAVVLVRQALADGLAPRELAAALVVRVSRVRAWARGAPRELGDPNADEIGRAVVRLAGRRCAVCATAWEPCDGCKARQGVDNAALVAGRPRRKAPEKTGWGNEKCPICFGIRCKRHGDDKNGN